MALPHGLMLLLSNVPMLAKNKARVSLDGPMEIGDVVGAEVAAGAGSETVGIVEMTGNDVAAAAGRGVVLVAVVMSVADTLRHRTRSRWGEGETPPQAVSSL